MHNSLNWSKVCTLYTYAHEELLERSFPPILINRDKISEQVTNISFVPSSLLQFCLVVCGAENLHQIYIEDKGYVSSINKLKTGIPTLHLRTCPTELKGLFLLQIPALNWPNS